MAPNFPHDGNPIVVAVDKDKHSASAVRWTIEHLLVTNATLVLVHVRTRNLHKQGLNGDADGESMEDIFSQFRALCVPKKIVMQVVILEGMNVHNTLLDYINSHRITNVALGASSRSPITRKFWTYDVPTMINKAAPDFCNVYVISKGKTQSVRPAGRRMIGLSPPGLLSPSLSRKGSVKLNPEDSCRGTSKRTDGSMHQHQELSTRLSKNSSLDGHHVISNRWTRNPSCDWKTVHVDLADSELNPGSTDIAKVQVLDSSVGQTTDHKRNSSSSANELQQMKVDEVQRLEQVRLAEEAAHVLVKVEKAKCRAAIEAAMKAQKIAEKETLRRKHAEMKAKREKKEKNRALDILSNNDIRYRKYTIEEIEAATNNFSRSMKIGEGGYGPVFKGKLDHTRVAIKILRPDAAQGRKQFQQEVEVLSFMRHPNMVLLMGACPEYGCLVYEYMNNGSLEDRLFRKGNTPPIPWGIRFKIAADIATGLLFLHRAEPEPLVHRDLKPANILLDRHYTCKISDVGLARLVPPSVADSVTQYHMTSAAGTFCYIDPEYQQTGKLGTKSDIYSLGMLLLQIITARPPMGLTHQVEKAIENGTFADLLDPTVPDWPVDEALGFAKLALKCAELRKKDRPDLAKVILPELNRLKELGMQHLSSQKSFSRRSSPRGSFS